MLSKARLVDHPHGYTLIEILVVLLILSIVAAFATLGINSYLRNREIRLLTQQFAVIVPTAQNQALLRGTVLGLFIKPHRYDFYQFSSDVNQHQGQWQLIKRNGTLRSDTTSSGIILRVTSDINKNNDLRTSSSINPQIIFFTDGTMTPFIITLSTVDNSTIYQIDSTTGGNIKIKKVK